MVSENGGNFYMPVAPAYSGNNGFGGGFGNDWGWIILLLLFAGGGWGGGFGGGFGADGLYPWINNSQNINNGFRDQMLNDNITSIKDAVTTGFASAEVANNARQMADMQQMFNLQSQLADCCCENRLGTADLKYTVATENCADRQAINEGVRDIIANQTAGIQRVLDQLCSDKLDAKNDEIAQLRQEVLYARGQASQIAQNSQIVDSIYNRLDTCPVGTTPVYGRTPIFSCNNGCGCNNGF